MRDPAALFRPLLAAVLVAALSGRAQAEDGWSPMIGHSLGEPACAAIDDPTGTPAFAEGGEDGASPAGPAALASPVASCAADALPEGWEAWPGWTPFGAEPAAAADAQAGTAAGLQSRTGGSTADPSGNAFIAPGLAPVWALWPSGIPRGAATSRSAPRDDALASPAPGEGDDTAEDDGDTILLVDGTDAVQAPPTGGSATIPEPATLVILGAAMAAAGLFGRRPPRRG